MKGQPQFSRLRMSLAFVGIKHSGKSSIGKLFASGLDIPFYDGDDMILSLYNRKNDQKIESIRELYKNAGKDSFMEYEVLSIESLISSNTCPVILSTGGGIIDNHDAVERLIGSFFIIFIDVAENILYERIIKKGIPPFLDTDNPRQSFSSLYARRREGYNHIADLSVSVENMTIEAGCDTIYKLLQEVSDVWE